MQVFIRQRSKFASAPYSTSSDVKTLAAMDGAPIREFEVPHPAMHFAARSCMFSIRCVDVYISSLKAADPEVEQSPDGGLESVTWHSS